MISLPLTDDQSVKTEIYIPTLKRTVEKNQTNAANVTMLLLMQAI